MCMLKFRENEEAVSPVIGVILMVAITVILAAVIAAFVFGMTDSFTAQKEVTVTASQGVTSVGDPAITVKLFGGKDVGFLEDSDKAFTVKINGADATAVEDSGTLTNKVGSSAVYELDDDGQHTVVVVAHFTDGTEQVVLDKVFTVAPENSE
jgi:flagellin-like protein